MEKVIEKLLEKYKDFILGSILIGLKEKERYVYIHTEYSSDKDDMFILRLRYEFSDNDLDGIKIDINEIRELIDLNDINSKEELFIILKEMNEDVEMREYQA